MRLGAHESVAGGPATAFERALRDGAECLQIFTKSARGWKAKPVDPIEAARFREESARTGLPTFAHGSYLVNLATQDAALRAKSIECVLDELARCEALGVPWLVYHPGSNADGKAGVRAIATALDEVHRATRKIRARILIENAAGQGSCIGATFEELADILAACPTSERLGVCIDTCHAWAAGYDLGSARGYSETMDVLDRTVGLTRVRAFHLNDCKKERGCRVDRHENIARGMMGTEGFLALVNDPRFADVPGALETPDPAIYPENLALLKAMRKRRRRKAASS